VAMDARRLQDRPYTGVGRILAGLLPLLAEQVELVLLTDARRPSPPESGEFKVVPLVIPKGLKEMFWLQVPVARWLRGFDGVFHGTYNGVPIVSRTPSVVSIYDLTWEHHPEDISQVRRLALIAQARAAVRRSAAVVTCSEFTREDLVSTYGVPADRVFNVPPSVDGLFSPSRADDAPPILKRLGVTGPYVAAIGGAKRRGLEVAVAAWRRLPAGPDRPSLVVVGSEAPPPEPGLVHAGRLSDDEWSAVLAGAMAFCYPTRYEGFGMPALEAAVSGVPVVCARIGPLPEVLGDAAEWCASPGVDDIGDGLTHVVADAGLRETLRTAGMAQAAKSPTWEHSAATLLRAYELAAR
jgi:glycosyltransferase involved in cell wall biosynthesis